MPQASLRLVPEFANHPAIARETQVFATSCACAARIEAGRAELHRTLDRVLVVDMRFNWNGVGNSLTRWLAVLRLGTAAGRATFLWFSDRELRDRSRSGQRAAAAAMAGRRLAHGERPYTLGNWRKRHGAQRAEGFDLGDYFVAIGADYRWSRGATYRRVAAAMAARNVTSPTLINYRCLHHTWACMRPVFEFGPMAEAGPEDDPSALNRPFARPPGHAEFTVETEKDGAMLSWLASRTEPWLVLRLNEQTALEQSQTPAAAALSGAWLGRAGATLYQTRASATAAGASSDTSQADAADDAATAAAIAATKAAANANGEGTAETEWQEWSRPFLEAPLPTHACGGAPTTSCTARWSLTIDYWPLTTDH